ncbi:SPJ_0845 family protein [Ligilactobacillus hayakitensis]|nr:SPJ_0845 family protein [Ligilactobacillus hayakitensis]
MGLKINRQNNLEKMFEEFATIDPKKEAKKEEKKNSNSSAKANDHKQK